MARTGRPRGFDRDEAVEAAMMLLWRQGFAATSLADLKSAMGALSPTSFYAAFGSKEGLCDAVLARYLETHGRVMAVLRDAAVPPREAIERALRGTIGMQTDPSHPPGCLVTLSAANGPAPGTPLAAAFAAERARTSADIRACVDRAVAQGELAGETDVVGLAALIDGLLAGISLRARDGAGPADLQRAVDALLRTWDAHRPRLQPAPA